MVGIRAVVGGGRGVLGGLAGRMIGNGKNRA